MDSCNDFGVNSDSADASSSRMLPKLEEAAGDMMMILESDIAASRAHLFRYVYPCSLLLAFRESLS
jgi:hypothetical protein